MQFALLLDILPDHRPELLAVRFQNHATIPDGEYVIEDGYCLEPGCDCSRAMLVVLDSTTGEKFATFSIGWQPRSFYEKWLGPEADPQMVEELPGPALWSSVPQHHCANDFLEQMTNALLNWEYKMRLKRRYQTFKNFVNRERQ